MSLFNARVAQSFGWDVAVCVVYSDEEWRYLLLAVADWQSCPYVFIRNIRNHPFADKHLIK